MIKVWNRRWYIQAVDVILFLISILVEYNITTVHLTLDPVPGIVLSIYRVWWFDASYGTERVFFLKKRFDIYGLSKYDSGKIVKTEENTVFGLFSPMSNVVF